LALAVFVVLESGGVEFFGQCDVLGVLFSRPGFFFVSFDEEEVAWLLELLGQLGKLRLDCEQPIEQRQLGLVFVGDRAEQLHLVLA
jgi:hypothetical protein